MDPMPACMTFFLPWFLFMALFAVMTFEIHYAMPVLCWALVFAGVLLAGAFGALGYRQMQKEANSHGRAEEHPAVEPNWYMILFLASMIAVVAACVLGILNFWSNTQPFYDGSNHNRYYDVDPSGTKGQQLMDAGMISFKQGARLDLAKAYSFQNQDVYCVAPVTMGATQLATYDFWAVGLNCCPSNSTVNADFRCGEYSNSEARQGLRLMRDDQRPFYRLAVQQAEAAYAIKSPHPLYFFWTSDAAADLNGFLVDGHKYYMYGVIGFFCLQFVLIVVALAVYET